MNRSRIFVVLLLLTAALSGIVIGRLFFTPGIPVPPRAIELQSGTALRPARPLPDFQLLRQDGVAAGRNEFLGRWTLVFFGFSHCPEVCPTTLAMLSGVRKALYAVVPAGELPGIALFSVDPERDTPAVLDAYLASFGPGFRGYTGTPEAMRKFATALGVPYQRTPMMDGEYMVDHSTAIMLINPQAEVAALFQAPHESAKLQVDYLQVVTAAR